MPPVPPDEYCLLWINLWPLCMTKGEWASWGQAIGTFVAVLATGVAAWWETHRRRVEAAQHFEAEVERAAELKKVEKANLMARLTITSLFAKLLSHYVKLLDEAEPGRSHRMREHYWPLRTMLGDANAIELREMSSSRAIGHLARVKGAIEQARVVLDAHGAEPPQPIEADLLKHASSQLSGLLLELQYMLDPDGMAQMTRDRVARGG